MKNRKNSKIESPFKSAKSGGLDSLSIERSFSEVSLDKHFESYSSVAAEKNASANAILRAPGGSIDIDTVQPSASTSPSTSAPASASASPQTSRSTKAKGPSHRTTNKVDFFSPIRQDDDDFFRTSNFSFMKFLQVEMLGIGQPEHVEPTAVANIMNFLNVPLKLESLLMFGFFICLDVFLYVFTYLPVRVVFALLTLLYQLVSQSISAVLRLFSKKIVHRRRHYFHRTQAYDLMRAALLIVGTYVLQMLNMSRVYHFIRGQSMIKLYVLTAMMDMFDTLLRSFGHDAFDSLFWQTRTHPEQVGQLLKILAVVAVYVIIHSGLYFTHIATLTVAINSSDSTLITLVILNNVAEIKAFVFKKFDTNILFQLACSDIAERFKVTLFLFCNLLVGMMQAGAVWDDSLISSHLSVFGLILLGEAITDYVKHAFVARLNHIDANVFDEFARILRKDILNSHKEKVILDHCYALTRRVGLSQIPLACVCIRYMILAVSSSSCQHYLQSISTQNIILGCGMLFLFLLLVKTILGVALIYYAGYRHNVELTTKRARQSSRGTDIASFKATKLF